MADTFVSQPGPFATNVAVQTQRLTLDVVGLTAFSHDFGECQAIARCGACVRCMCAWRACVWAWRRHSLRLAVVGGGQHWCIRGQLPGAGVRRGQALAMPAPRPPPPPACRDVGGRAQPSESDQDRLLWAVNAFGQVLGEVFITPMPLLRLMDAVGLR